MNKKSEPVALIDMDGTLCDFDGAMNEAMERIKSPEERRANFYSAFKIPYISARRELIKSQPGFWRNLKPLESGFKIVEILRELDFELHILTKGPQKSTNAWTEKVEWCQEHIPDASIVIAQDKGLVYGKVLVDDWPSYVHRWLEWRPRGFVIMPAQTWNNTFSHPNVWRYVEGKSSWMLRERLEEIRRTV